MLPKKTRARRLALLARIKKSGDPVTMGGNPAIVQEDLRWLWRNDYLQVVDTGPLHFYVTHAGEIKLEEEEIKAREARQFRHGDQPELDEKGHT